LDSKADDKEYIFCKVNWGMYGLPQARKLAQDQLSKRLNEVGYITKAKQHRNTGSTNDSRSALH